MRHGVGHEREASQDNETAEYAVSEADQGAAKEGAQHEFMPERFEQPVHAPNETAAS